MRGLLKGAKISSILRYDTPFRRYRRKKGNDEVDIVRPSEEISPPSKIKLVRKFVRLTFFVGLTF